MKNSLILVVKGFFMGIANIIPGVSGGTIALILGIYEKFIGAISHFFSNFKENMKFLIPIFIGMALSLLTLSHLIDYSYKHAPIPTCLFFVGLVLGGIPLIINHIKDKKDRKKISNYPIFLITFLIVIFMACASLIFDTDLTVKLNNLSLIGYILLFLVGIIAAATMVVPGVSGSLVLMMLGYYYPIIENIKNLTEFNNITNNIIVLGIFGIGILVGIVLASKLIEYLFKKYETKTYYGVLGFIVASVIAIPLSTYLQVTNLHESLLHILIGIITCILGIFVSYKLGDK